MSCFLSLIQSQATEERFTYIYYTLMKTSIASQILNKKLMASKGGIVGSTILFY